MTATERPDNLLALVRPEIMQLPGYEPVEPVAVLAAKLGLQPDQIAKLDGNENPYGPSPRALAALARLRDYHIYPDPDETALRTALAKHLGLAPEYIVAGAGSDELIQLLCTVFLRPGDRVIDLVPTFGMYRFEAEIAGGEVVRIQRRADFSVDVAAVAAAVDQRTRLIFATSPNNPTGNLLTRAELDGLLELRLPVVVDEAYIEFAAGESGVGLVPHKPNLIVLRTFSKWAGLAGLRVGYAVMAPELAEILFRIRQPYSVNVAAEVAAVVSLEDAATLLSRVQAIIAERDRLFVVLAAVPYLEPLPSRANFILCNVLRGNPRQIRDALRSHGVFVRYFDTPLLQNCIRISVGLPKHTAQVATALAAVGQDLFLS